MSDVRRLQITCPDCGAQMVVDAATGEILSHRSAARPLAGGHTFEGLLEDLDAGRAAAEDRFAQEVAAQKDRERLLEEKFREALRRAEEDPDDSPPPRPFDLD